MRYPALNGLRALAATAVVTTHAAYLSGAYTNDTLGHALARLDVGVALFFVLSGFLLSQPFFRAAAEGRPAPRAAAFLWRRALRILPAYWALVVVAMTVLPGNRGAPPGEWLQYLGLAQLYKRDWTAEGLDHAWSLCTEVAFYAVLPALAAGLLAATGRGWHPRRLLALLGVLSVGGLAWVAWSASDELLLAPLELWLPAFLSWFCTGMALAVVTVSDPGTVLVRRVAEVAGSPWTCWGLAAALFWIASGPITGPVDLSVPFTGTQGVTKTLLFTLVAGLAVLPLVLGEGTRRGAHRLLSSRPAHWLGEVSYGIFLFHMPLLLLLFDPFEHPLAVVLPVTWVAAVGAAAVSYHLLERPIVDRLRGLVPDRRAAVPDTDGVAAGGAAGGISPTA